MRLPSLERGATEHYDDAVLYDYEYRRRRRDANFYRRLADRFAGSARAPILELACGSGRVTGALVRAGYRVIGLDRSPSMLAQAAARIARMPRAHRERVHLLRADIRSFELGRRFALIVMAFNSFEHLYTDADVAACMSCVRRALSPGGVFAFDVNNPDMPWLQRDPDKRWARTEFRHPGTGARLVYSTNHIYDPLSQICRIRIYYAPARPGPAQERVVHLSQRKFFPTDLAELVAKNGFEVVEHCGDFAGEPLSGAAESQVLVCSLANRRAAQLPAG